MRRAAALAVALVLSPLLLGADVARAAEMRRVESVGVFPIQPSGAGRQAPRDGAVRAAVARGVEGVAQELLPEGWQADVPPVLAPEGRERKSGPGDIEPMLAIALGPNPFEYATRYRTIEDRGVRSALFTRDPDVETEYVVVVEVFVDAGRVRERLHTAGWLITPAGQDSGSQVRLVLKGLSSFGAYDALRRTLLEELEVSSALPVELSRGRAVLAVDGPYGAAALEEALVERAEDGLRVVPLDRDGQTLTLLVDWTPPASPAPASEAEALGDPPLADGPPSSSPTLRD